ncbi:MAG: FIST signal transduction protein, partial [Pirellulaceae bacterium]
MSSSPQFRFASALSTQSDLAEALEQVCESALGQLQATPHLAVLFVGSEYGSLDDGLAARVSARLSAGMLWGGTAEAIVGRGQEIEGQPAVSLWLAHMENVRLIPMHL